ncbi:ABC transporter ATP-binding protein [Roseomonas sp. 18066]|uniref:ABC transporter ATP-binding protein n=1 Tax=Roseomonas sp. 18066 TaxID=2681412 RepID=UPI00135CE397|nr:ABC transporter ATP-binding protein [Roseomonas sp. 18066]
MQPRLRAVDLSFGYGAAPVLRQVSLDIAPGQLTVLVGPNGSGKSTLLGALARLLRPGSGAVLLDGQAIARRPTREVARILGVLPQNPPLPEAITVHELVARGRFPHRGTFGGLGPADHAAIEAALRATGTLDLARRPVEALSGGQRQRCWIAMALAQETPLILLDEPTAFLDWRYQVEVLDLLRALTREHGRTIVVALHELNLAASHADRVVFFRDGRVVAEGPVAEACTAATIEAVFGLKVLCLDHPRTGRPVFVPAG